MAEKMVTMRDVRNAVDGAIHTEKRMCKSYSELNPSDAERRKRDADLYILGAEMVWARLQNDLDEKGEKE